MHCPSKSSRLAVVHEEIFAGCLDGSPRLLATVFRLERNDYGRTFLSNRSIGCLRHCHIELVRRIYCRENLIPLSFVRVMWFAGGLAALSSITYPSISAFVSVYAKENQQGTKIDVTAESTELWFRSGPRHGQRCSWFVQWSRSRSVRLYFLFIQCEFE